jgi:hypothetical protein
MEYKCNCTEVYTGIKKWLLISVVEIDIGHLQSARVYNINVTGNCSGGIGRFPEFVTSSSEVDCNQVAPVLTPVHPCLSSVCALFLYCSSARILDQKSHTDELMIKERLHATVKISCDGYCYRLEVGSRPNH